MIWMALSLALLATVLTGVILGTRRDSLNRSRRLEEIRAATPAVCPSCEMFPEIKAVEDIIQARMKDLGSPGQNGPGLSAPSEEAEEGELSHDTKILSAIDVKIEDIKRFAAEKKADK